MKKEKIVNLFLFVNDGVIRELGVKWHDGTGDDRHKLAFLQTMVDTDLKVCKRRPLAEQCLLFHPDGQREKGALQYDTFMRLAQVGKQMEVLENSVFKFYDFCPRDPLMVITPVVDGKIKIEGTCGPPK